MSKRDRKNSRLHRGASARRISPWICGVSAGTFLGLGAVLAWAQEAPPRPAPPQPALADPKAMEFFETKIRPLFAQQCFACHGDKQQKGGLRMDTAAGFFKGGDMGAMVVPGHPEKSLLLDVVGYSKDLKMPPQGKLKPQQIADLTAWVKMGAPWPNAKLAPAPAKTGGALFTEEQKKFWAFQPVRNPAVPPVKNRAWVASPIDQFLLAKLEAKGLKPAAKADRRTLIRRVTYDLTGLPPTPEEVQAFVADRSPDAWEKVVDRLLASPAYGERWGRHWLDVARYADSNGLDENTAFANAWRYRDYVVRAFNQDKPYDEFVKEQIAGDLMPPSSDPKLDADRLTATGFLVLGPKVLAEPDKQKMVMDIVDEQIDTMGKAFMGLTLGCARCHDHKFDPLPTRDYYSLAGIFKSTRTMQTLATVAKAYERPLEDKEGLQKLEAHKRLVEKKQGELKEARYRLNTETAAGLLQNLDRYLVLGLEADVEPSREAAAPDLKRPGAVVLEAEKFARGDVKVTGGGTPESFGYIESAGRSAAFTEYEVQVAGGPHEVFFRYASGESRPVKLSLDGRTLLADAAKRSTGGFGPGEQEWEVVTHVTLAPGKHLLRIDQAAGSLPHIDKVVLLPAAAVAPAPASEGRKRRKPAELAKEHGLDAEFLRRSAAHVQGAPARGDRIWAAWSLFAALPQDRFTEEARKALAEWKAAGKLKDWHPKVAALFNGEAPASLQEVAARYETLFLEVNQAWQNQVRRAMRPPARLGNSEMEELRQVLYGRGGFGLDRIERLFTAEAKASLDRLQAEVKGLEEKAPDVPMVLAVEDAPEIANVKVHIRGNHLALGEEAPRVFLRIVAGEQQQPVPPKRSGRLELAEWLTRPDHPLTARVMVNRIWQHHFGEGIVRTPDNFGKLGDRPTHPELLDWLAKRFVEKGWSVKAMHRMILLSNAYQMSTTYDERSALADPENRLFWRFNRRRLEVEAIRDAMLAATGELNRTMGGSLLKTPNFAYVTNDQSANQAQYDSTRRAIYLPVIRNAVYDVFQVFDFVEPSFLNGKRSSTTVAPQALFMMNGQFVLERSKTLAEQLLKQPGEDADRIRSAYLRAYGRSPEPAETASALEYLKLYEARLAAKESDPAKRRQAAWASYCQILFASSEFVYVN